MSLKKMTRIDKISQLLIAKTGVSIRELAVELGVSEITIRRDLKQLEQHQRLRHNEMLHLEHLLCLSCRLLFQK